MKKAKPLLAILMAGLLTASVAFGAVNWSSDRTISEVVVEADHSGSGVGEVYIKFSSTPFSTSCSLGNTYWVVGGNPDSVKAMQSLAVAAKLSNGSVQALWNDSYSGSASCTSSATGYPVLRGLRLRP